MVKTNNIGFTQDEWISLVDRRMKKYNYPTLSDAKQSTADVSTEQGSVILCEKYELTDGIEFYFWGQTTSEPLQQMIFYVDKSKLSAPDYPMLGYLEGSLPFFLEPDSYKELEKQLNLSIVNDALKTTDTTASGEKRQYEFKKEANISTLYVYPIGRDIISLDMIEFEEDSTSNSDYEKENQSEWTADRFIKEIDTRLANASFPTLSSKEITTYEDNVTRDKGYIGLETSFGYAANCNLYPSKETNRLEELFFFCDFGKANSDSLCAWGFALTTCIKMFDFDDYESISAALKIDQVSQDTYREASGTLMDYIYIVEGNTIACLISQKSDKPAIDTTENNNDLQFSSSSDSESGGTALLSQSEFTAEEFIARMDQQLKSISRTPLSSYNLKVDFIRNNEAKRYRFYLTEGKSEIRIQIQEDTTSGKIDCLFIEETNIPDYTNYSSTFATSLLDLSLNILDPTSADKILEESSNQDLIKGLNVKGNNWEGYFSIYWEDNGFTLSYGLGPIK